MLLSWGAVLARVGGSRWSSPATFRRGHCHRASICAQEFVKRSYPLGQSWHRVDGLYVAPDVKRQHGVSLDANPTGPGLKSPGGPRRAQQNRQNSQNLWLRLSTQPFFARTNSAGIESAISMGTSPPRQGPGRPNWPDVCECLGAWYETPSSRNARQSFCLSDLLLFVLAVSRQDRPRGPTNSRYFLVPATTFFIAETM